MSETRKIEAALMKTSELAQRVGYTSETLLDWVRDGKNFIPQPVVKSRTRVYFNRKQASQWARDFCEGRLS